MIIPVIGGRTTTAMFLVFLSVLCSSSNIVSTDAFVIPNNNIFAAPITTTTTTTTTTTVTTTTLYYSESPEQALQRTAAQLEKLKRRSPRSSSSTLDTDSEQQQEEEVDDQVEVLYQDYLRQSANALKVELNIRNLPQKGRKPDLARRLAIYEIQKRSNQYMEDEQSSSSSSSTQDDEAIPWETMTKKENNGIKPKLISTFCGLKISLVAGQALGKAKFYSPSPIQDISIPKLVQGESLILHAETGSGKTLAYLLPITEQLWYECTTINNNDDIVDSGYGIILTPTRELAAQVAGIATVLAPPGTVRLVSHPTNLMSKQSHLKDKGEQEHGGRLDDENDNGRTSPRLFVGSAKAVMHSLYGDGKMPASPTRKPDAMHLLQNTRWLVLDEVDRLLNIKKARGGGSNQKKSSSKKSHEKPAAVVTAAAARMTLGRVQVISASATVGRPLKRELTRVLGLAPQDCPDVVRGGNNDSSSSSSSSSDSDSGGKEQLSSNKNDGGRTTGRAVTIPNTVKNYITGVDTSSVGKLLTSAFFVIKSLNNNKEKKKNRRMLLVLTRGCGINTQNAIGALKHFRCQPEPKSLLDALQAADGTDSMMQVHRQVSRATGIGEAYFQSKDNNSNDQQGDSSSNNKDDDDDEEDDDGYLLVTGEDTVRGLHLDGLDYVIVVGRPRGPDEYTHIAGRTGRAGRQGKVINVLSHENAAAMKAWEQMLDVQFDRLELEDIASLD